jgi:hypothetical protein
MYAMVDFPQGDETLFAIVSPTVFGHERGLPFETLYGRKRDAVLLAIEGFLGVVPVV